MHIGKKQTKQANQAILKESNPEYSLERLMLKLQYFGHLMQRADSLEKTLMLERLRAGGEGMTEDEMAGWHHRLNGHGTEQSLGDSEGQGSLACCSPWGCKESDMTARLKTTTKAQYLSTCALEMELSLTINTGFQSAAPGPAEAWKPVLPNTSHFLFLQPCADHPNPKPSEWLVRW